VAQDGTGTASGASLASLNSGSSGSSPRGGALAAALSEEGSAVNANLYVLLRACDRCVWVCLVFLEGEGAAVAEVCLLLLNTPHACCPRPLLIH
jgi:hypothetical protein